VEGLARGPEPGRRKISFIGNPSAFILYENKDKGSSIIDYGFLSLSARVLPRHCERSEATFAIARGQEPRRRKIAFIDNPSAFILYEHKDKGSSIIDYGFLSLSARVFPRQRGPFPVIARVA
jgi:hypothetical protein